MKAIFTMLAVSAIFTASCPAFAGDYILAGGGFVGSTVNVRGTNHVYYGFSAARPNDNVFCETGSDYCYATQARDAMGRKGKLLDEGFFVTGGRVTSGKLVYMAVFQKEGSTAPIVCLVTSNEGAKNNTNRRTSFSFGAPSCK